MSSKATATRLNILNKAFELIYRNGYRTTSVDQIIATTQVTKGAFFHHFKNKDDMGITMINEVMYPAMSKSLTALLEDAKDPKEAIYLMMKNILFENPFFEIKYGCPAINLIEELANYNDSFNDALQKLVKHWKNAITKCLENGKNVGQIKPDVDTEEVAFFILAGYGGVRNLGKIYGLQSYTAYIKQLKLYLEHL
jgi:TetR/AcrR family transcriptional repressor of nem operon